MAQARDPVRAAGDRGAVGRRRAGWHVAGPDHLLAEAVERDRLPRRGDRPGPDAALRPGPAGAGPPALVAEPAGAVGAGGQRPPGRVRRRRELLRAGPGTHPPGRTARVARAGDP